MSKLYSEFLQDMSPLSFELEEARIKRKVNHYKKWWARIQGAKKTRSKRK